MLKKKKIDHALINTYLSFIVRGKSLIKCIFHMLFSLITYLTNKQMWDR